MKEISLIDDYFINQNTQFADLIKQLKIAFASSNVEIPLRHHHEFSNPEEEIDSTLLLMPSWSPGKDAGVKIITVSPHNIKHKLPTIQGVYIYLDARKGTVKAILSAKSLTAKRTAATSALAASFLARKDASSLLMIGTGALSANLIVAHASVRPLKEVYVWGRTLSKARAICDELINENFNIQAIDSIATVISEVDIISCATLSKTPLVLGKYLKEGQHIDLVGSYKKDTREADDEAIQKCQIFIDSYQGGMKDSGDILVPLEKGIITEKDIKADLFELCSHKKQGRKSNQEITCFKSVGYALEDLTAATYYFNKFKNIRSSDFS